MTEQGVNERVLQCSWAEKRGALKKKDRKVGWVACALVVLAAASPPPPSFPHMIQEKTWNTLLLTILLSTRETR